MSDVERRKRILAGVEQVDLLAVAGSIIQRLREGVARQVTEMGYALTHTRLERVVIGVAGGDEVALAGEVLSEGPARAVDGSSGGGGVHAVLPIGSTGRGTWSHL